MEDISLCKTAANVSLAALIGGQSAVTTISSSIVSYLEPADCIKLCEWCCCIVMFAENTES